MVSRNGQFYFPVYDNNGNIMKYVDESGTVVSSYVYDDFGRTISQTGELADSFSFRFSTKYLDRETSLVAYQRRFCGSARKSWLNRDPIEEEGGVNLYAFCANNGVVYFDPVGKCKDNNVVDIKLIEISITPGIDNVNIGLAGLASVKASLRASFDIIVGVNVSSDSPDFYGGIYLDHDISISRKIGFTEKPIISNTSLMNGTSTRIPLVEF